jgi:nicotinamide mononucleotide transporter
VDVFCSWLTAHGSSCLELVGAVIGVVSVLLGVRQNVWYWPTALVNVALYTVLFYQLGLYSDMGLQVVYFVLSVYGWYQWLHGGTDNTELRVTRTPRRLWAVLAVISILFWIADGAVVSRLPNASLPFIDAALATISLVAQYLTTKKWLENWALWIAVDVVYVGMYVYKGVSLTAINYAVYLVLAVMGHVAWKRSMHAPAAEAVA